MNKKILFFALVALVPSSALAQANNVGSCGWGSKVFDGKSGIFPQILAVTTNGTSMNQLFGISSGTSGCTQDGVVRSAWKTAMFIDANKNKLARDMSVGQGESLDSLSSLIGVAPADKSSFFALAKNNFGTIFPADDVSTEQVVASLKSVIAADSQLAGYAAVL